MEGGEVSWSRGKGRGTEGITEMVADNFENGLARHDEKGVWGGVPGGGSARGRSMTIPPRVDALEKDRKLQGGRRYREKTIGSSKS